MTMMKATTMSCTLVMTLGMSACNGDDDRFEGRVRSTGHSPGVGVGSSAGQQAEETRFRVLGGTYQGRLGSVSESANAPMLEIANNSIETAVTLWAESGRSMVQVRLMQDLYAPADWDSNPLDTASATVTGCSGPTQGWDWEDTIPPVEIDVTDEGTTDEGLPLVGLEGRAWFNDGSEVDAVILGELVE